MEKLIELLNEFLKKEDKSIYTFYWDKVFNCIHRFNGERCDKERICSKSFGFIKWLVDNDKIDYKKCIKEFRMKDFGKFYYMSKAEVVIANLSIQDNSLEFLVSILR